VARQPRAVPSFCAGRPDLGGWLHPAGAPGGTPQRRLYAGRRVIARAADVSTDLRAMAHRAAASLFALE
jgi:hypothetical protein